MLVRCAVHCAALSSRCGRTFSAVFRCAQQLYEGKTNGTRLTVSLGMVVSGCFGPAKVLQEDVVAVVVAVVCCVLCDLPFWCVSVVRLVSLAFNMDRLDLLEYNEKARVSK